MNLITKIKNTPTYKKYKLIVGVLQRIYIYVTPFVLAVCSIIQGINTLENKVTAYTYISTCTTGNSIWVIGAILILTKSMCKWYKAACYILIANRAFEILFYWMYFKIEYRVLDNLFIPYALIICGTASFLAWFLSDSIRKTYNLISRVCKRVQR